MKKLIALLLALVMVLSLAACGDSDTGSRKKNKKKNSGTTGEALEMTLWTLDYDTELWEYEEDDLSDYDEFSELTLQIPGDEEDSYRISVEIRASLEDASPFRGYLESFGFDAYDYAENNAYDLENVGGVDCLVYESESWGESCLRYFGRVEEASLTVLITIHGETEDTQVDDLLEGLSFLVEDIGYVDAPWPWNGEPFSSDGGSATVGGITLNSQWLPISDGIITNETFDHAVAADGSTVYLLVNGELQQYSLGSNSLVLNNTLTQSEDLRVMQHTATGLWVSGFMEDLQQWQGGHAVNAFDGPDYVSMHPSGTWGISWFSSPDCEKITLSGSSISSTDISFPQVSTISTLLVDNSYIYVCGYAADESGHKVFVYDHSGSLKMILTDEAGDALGSITFIAQIPGGFLGMDGNMRDVVLWSADGTYLGSIEDHDLFGTSYPWFCGGAVLDDGSILVIMTEDRDDESAMELVAFKLSIQ